jgi:predicted AlkP superfamily pyrophosphatase or phosphodiesterase
MTAIDDEHTIPIPKEIDLQRFKVPPGNAMLHVYANNKKDIKPTYDAIKAVAKNYDVYLAKDIPKAWHYNKKEDRHNRVGDMILIPKLPYVFSINGIKPDIGQHGFDPAITAMHASFYAWGPQFKTNLKIAAFENVHVYPIIAKLLGLSYTNKIDGKLREVKGMLR